MYPFLHVIISPVVYYRLDNPLFDQAIQVLDHVFSVPLDPDMIEDSLRVDYLMPKNVYARDKVVPLIPDHRLVHHSTHASKVSFIAITSSPCRFHVLY